MALFPAYAQGTNTDNCIQIPATVEDIVSPTLEASLLASDEEESPTQENVNENQAPSTVPESPPPTRDFYQDRARDPGNLRMSTLYYPGRPNYSWRSELTLGSVAINRERRKRRLKRYYEASVASLATTPVDEEVAARSATYRRLLADSPTDVALWLRYINFQESCVGGEAALEAAAEGCARVGAGAGARILRDARLELARRHLLPGARLQLVRDLIHTGLQSSSCSGLNRPFSLQELKSALFDYKDSAPGADGIPYSFFANISDNILSYYLQLINTIMITGDIPLSWKSQIVLPILKPNKPPSHASSYRPIVLATVLIKLAELLIKNRLEWYLESRGMLSKTQYGFRKGKKYNGQFKYFITDIRLAFNYNESVVSSILDINSAYDHVLLSVLKK
ncbi:hypothetical protein evm_006120 [Chilo suppressalis]|nr:hypothetical protein evm_006120 [Chilo suppressalis]